MEHGTHLIVGGDGLIGGALAQLLDERRIPHLITTRRLNTVTGNRLFLDLGRDTNSFKIASDVSHCYVCAAVTKQSECESNPDKTRAVNVMGAVNIAVLLPDIAPAELVADIVKLIGLVRHDP